MIALSCMLAQLCDGYRFHIRFMFTLGLEHVQPRKRADMTEKLLTEM